MINESTDSGPELGKSECFPGILYAKTWGNNSLTSRITTTYEYNPELYILFLLA